MKLCPEHDAELKAELLLHQLEVPKDTNDPEAQYQRLTGTVTFANFDPYFYAKNTLMFSATLVLSQGCLASDLCPVCAVERKHKSVCDGDEGCKFKIEEWIPECVKFAKEVFLGLCGKEQTH